VISRRRLLLAAPAGFLPGCGKQERFSGYVFVADEEGERVAVVDLGALAVIRRLPLGAAPSSILAHPSEPFVYALTPGSGTIHEVDSRSLTVTWRVSLGKPLLSMLLSPDGSSLWTAATVTPELIQIPVATFRPEARIALPAVPVDFALSPRKPHAAVSFGGGGRVALVDLTARRIFHDGPASEQSGAIRFRSDGEHVLVADPATRRLSIVDVVSGAVVTQLKLAIRPDNLCFGGGGGQLFITGEGMDAVVIVYPYRTEVAQTQLAGHNPGAMAVSSGQSAWLFVANPKAGDVTIIDIDTQRVIAVAAVGADPSFITVTPNDQYALVLNRASGDMAIIRLGAVKSDRRRSAPLLTMIPVGSRPVAAAVREL
jgi:YVTN family beta-propeller protein